MARVDLIQTNMTGGELSPALALGRPDIAKYSNGLRRAENVTLTVQGGAKRRPGTLYLGTVRDTTNRVRLIEFIYNRDQAYALELGDGYIRFLRNRALILAGAAPYQVATPYNVNLLSTINYVQKADTAFFTQETVTPMRLQRFAETQWALAPAPFLPAPVDEIGTRPAAALTLGATSGATTATSSTGAFYASDQGRLLQFGTGAALITSYVSPTVVNVQVQRAFAAATAAAGAWLLAGSPMSTIVPSNAAAVGDTVSLASGSAALGPFKNITAASVVEVGFLKVTLAGHGFPNESTIVVSSAVKDSTTVAAANGRQVITVLDADTFKYPYSGTVTSLTGGQAQLLLDTVPSAVWRAEDVGKIVSVDGGSVLIAKVLSPTVANGQVLRKITAATLASAGSWTLEAPAWNATNGYPRAVTIYKQRLMFAGSPAYPQYIWASAIQGYLDFGFGVEADEPFRFELDGARNSPIRHLAPTRQLFVMTDSDEMSVGGGQDGTITPTTVQKTDQSTVGTGSVRPVKIGSELIFVPPTGKRVYAAGYRFDVDGFSAVERSVFATHITGPGVVEFTYRKEGDQQLLAMRSDGVIAACAYDIDQEVTGWSRWTTAGGFESFTTIPTTTGEDTYLAARRTIGGQERRYLEVFDSGMLVDCGISATSPAAAGQEVWTGLAHLEGRMAAVYADGAYLGEFLVSAGQVTLPRKAVYVQIGLAFRVLIEPLQIELSSGGSTAQGNPVTVREVVLRFLDSAGALVNGQPLDFRQLDTPQLDLPPPLATGDLRTFLLGDQIYLSKLVIEQPYPMPFHLLDIIRRVTVNG